MAVMAFIGQMVYINYVEIYHPFSTYYHEIKGYIKNGQKDE